MAGRSNYSNSYENFFVKDKFNIYMTVSLYNRLKEDAENFKIFQGSSAKKNKEPGTQSELKINWNRFLNLIVENYYQEFLEETNASYDEILACLPAGNLKEETREKTAREIVKKIMAWRVPEFKEKKVKTVACKPTKETNGIFQELFRNPAFETKSETGYLCLMFYSYLQKPFYKREAIIYRKMYETLKSYCSGPVRTQRNVWLKEGEELLIYPYDVCHGPDELYNYLIGLVEKEDGTFQTKSIHIHAIQHVSTISKPKSITLYSDSEQKTSRRKKQKSGAKSNSTDQPMQTITEQNQKNEPMTQLQTAIRNLEKMKYYGPAYKINLTVDSENSDLSNAIKIRLNDYAYNLYYKRIVNFQRPEAIKTEKDDEFTYLYFDCSEMQVFNYFKRIGEKSVKVIWPESLKKRFIRFYKDGIAMYEDT